MSIQSIDMDLLLSVLAAVSGATWTAHIWRTQRNKEFSDTETRRVALYAMPFLMATQALQSRLYNILELDGLGSLRGREHDQEFIVLAARYFGWERCMIRYTHHGRNPEFIRVTQRIRGAFANDAKFGEGIRIFHNDQDELGRLALERYRSEFGVEFDAIGKVPLLRTIGDNREITAALDTAFAEFAEAATLDAINPRTRARMSQLQHLLCELLEQVEQMESLRLTDKPRLRSKEPTHPV